MVFMNSPFWQFSIDRYRRAGVPELCLELQDETGLDVNVLLFLLWIGSQRRKISAPVAFPAIEAAVGDWHRDIVVPLRRVRRHMKGLHGPRPECTEEVRSRLKTVELETEQLEQHMLYALFEGRPEGFLLSGRSEAENAMMHNTSEYLSRLGGRSDRKDAAVRQLVQLCHESESFHLDTVPTSISN